MSIEEEIDVEPIYLPQLWASAPTLAVILGSVTVQANAATVWLGLRMTTSAALNPAAPAEGAVAPDDPAVG